MSPEPNPKHKRQKFEERIAELEKQLDESKKLAETYLTQLKYARADLDNTSKLAQRRADDAIVRATARIVEGLLPIVDELGLAVLNMKDSEGVEGLKMLYSKLLKFLESEGVKPIEAVGKPFDPFKHEAVVEVESENYPPGTVAEEIRRGYTYKDKVLRACMVKVARAPSEKKEEKKCV